MKEKIIKKMAEEKKSARFSGIKYFNINSKKPKKKNLDLSEQIKFESLQESADKLAVKSLPNKNTNTPASVKSKKPFNKKAKIPTIKIAFLGGLNQVGKNITIFETEKDILIVDCGMAFPDNEMLGVDFVIPDFSYLITNKDKIKGLVVTHGHEDHIGGIAYLLNKINIPIYATPLTLGLITSKLKENKLFGNANLNTVKPGEKIKVGEFGIEFVHINHSIPDAVSLAIQTPAGLIVHTGDFKIDCTPSRGEMINLARFSELGKQGVLALMADSTNAERPGYTPTERKIDDSFEKLFLKAGNKRIVVATFASNLGRIQQIINCAIKSERKVAFSGRSMINYVTIARELNYIDVPDGVIIDIDLITRYTNGEIVLITTGSQGEPMSALHRMAFSDHKKVSVGPEDFIIISATPIPGNEKTVGAVVNELMKLGCEVIYESMYETHVSGHACQEELKIIQALTKPKFFIPIHGERRHLAKHAELAKSMGIPSENIYIGETGDVLELSANRMKKLTQIPLELVFVDGIGVGDVGNIVLKDRKHLGQDGLIIAVAVLNSADKSIVSGPDIVSRGFVYVRESEQLMEQARSVVLKSIESCTNKKIRDWGTIKTKMRDDLYKFFHSKTKRNPVILPIIMEV